MNINKANKYKLNNGFTIVELLVVIVVIGILAAITLVSYRGLTGKASESTIQADLANTKKQFELYKVEHNVYPTGLDGNNCPTNAAITPVDTNYCLKPGTDTAYTLNSDANSLHYTIRATKGSLLYSVSDIKAPAPTVAIDSNWTTIGSQTWAKANLNVGTMITGVTVQTNNAVLEKYCYNNTESNCTTYGALYQWNEAMQYAANEGAQGVCPVGSHVPSDNDWKILEISLSMTQSQADTPNTYRGTDQGTQLKSGGTSGLNLPLAGLRSSGGSFNLLPSTGYMWSSSESSTSAWYRALDSGYATVLRAMAGKAAGLSVRCLGN